MAAWTIAKSRMDEGPGRTGIAVCNAIAFQSETTSARASPAQLRHMHTIRLVSCNDLFIVDFLAICDLLFGQQEPSESRFGRNVGLATDASNDAATPSVVSSNQKVVMLRVRV